MPHLRKVLIACAIVAMLLVTFGVSAAQAQASPATRTCLGTIVVLNAAHPAGVSSCIAWKGHASPAAVAHSVNTTCIADRGVFAWWNINFGGSYLCLEGNGSYELWKSCVLWIGPFCNVSWDDNISSYENYGWGTGYWEDNLNLTHFSITALQVIGNLNDYIWSEPTTWNDHFHVFVISGN